MNITQFLGIQTIPSKAQKLIRTFLLLSLVGAFLGNLSSTFFILFAIDKLGFTQASIIMSFVLLVQVCTDYPSGSLGDWIGQRWVLVIAFICYGVFYFLLTIATTFGGFLVLAFFNGLANAQASGTFGTWLDNNYQKVVEDADPERKIYGFTNARIGSLNRTIMAIAFVVGGLMATIISREHVFFIQACLSFVLLIMCFLLVKDLKVETAEELVSTKTSVREYFSFFIGGFKFLFSSKTAFFFLIGISMIFSAFNVWGTLMLFPIYFGYTGSDGLASLFRTTMFFVGIPLGIVMANASKRFSNEKYAIFAFLGLLFYFPPFILLLTVIPITNSFNLLGLVLTALILTVSINCLLDIAGILQGRTMLDLIPSENRNSVYSLIPTLVSVIAIPILPIAGKLIEDHGMVAGVIVPLFISLIGASFVFFSRYSEKSGDSPTQDNFESGSLS
ncbi:MAG: MFS transporter [Candidatus Hodarchaeales archaeon]